MRRLQAAFAALALTLGAGGACRAQGMGDWCRAVPLERSFCRALTVDVPKGTLRLAIATTGDERERGLMGVRSVPRGEGMLFVFPDPADRMHDFWMKDTLVPLDMVFVRRDGTVSSIAARVPAMKPHARDADIAHRAGLCRYVIELRSGGAAAAGITPGVRVAIPALAVS